MEPHIKVARVHCALAFVYALLAVLLSLLLIGRLSYYEKIGLIAFLIVLGCVFALHLSISIFASRQKVWARTLSQITGWLFLLGFPIGTMVGLYIIVISSKPWTTSSSPSASSGVTDVRDRIPPTWS